MEIEDKLKVKPMTKRMLINDNYNNNTERKKLDRKLKELKRFYVIGECNFKSRIFLFFSFNKEYCLFKTKYNEIYYGTDKKILFNGKIIFKDLFLFNNHKWLKTSEQFYLNDMELVI